MQEKSKYCCEEHLDMSFDDFLIDNETFPHMEKCEEKSCDYCEKKARYELKAPDERVSEEEAPQ